MPSTIRVWDLPTRCFHWLFALCVLAALTTGLVGGGAMVWHFRLGYCVLGLLVFRLIWGFIGGRWSRFGSFIYAPSSLLRYLRDPSSHQDLGHSPLGALAVFALLGVIGLQVITGLSSDDAITFTGPLASLLSSNWVDRASYWHKNWGQYLVITIIAMHLVANFYYAAVRRKRLIGAMVHGNKPSLHALDGAADGWAVRLLALVIAAACAALAYWVSGLA